jgi:hypothetical protein
VITATPDPGGGTNRNIVPNPYPWRRGGSHDPWASHSVTASLGYSHGGDFTQPLMTQSSATFALKDGNTYTYLYGDIGHCWDGTALYLATENFFNDYPPGPWIGEGFNAVMRKAPTLKMLSSSLAGYLLAFGAEPSACPPPP